MTALITTLWTLFLCILIGGTAIPLLTIFCERTIMRKSSAAAKHRLWTVTSIGLLMFPMLALVPLPGSQTETIDTASVVVPDPVPAPVAEPVLIPQAPPYIPQTPQPLPVEWPQTQPIPVPQEQTQITESNAQSQEHSELCTLNSELAETNWKKIAVAIWLAGIAWFGVCWLRTHLRAAMFLMQCRDEEKQLHTSHSSLHTSSKVRVVYHKRIPVPLAMGIFRPVIFFPPDAVNWPEEKTRIVLLHELAHVTRRDLFWQNFVRLVCIFYWPLPTVWHLAHRVRTEQESACDDMVLQSGLRGSDYADVLLGLSKSQSHLARIPDAGITMIRRNTVKKRIDAVLDSQTCRTPVNPILGVLLLCGVTLLTAIVSIFTPKIPFSMPVFARNTDVSPTLLSQTELQTDEPQPNEPPVPVTTIPFQYTYTGIVVDENGNPVENATVELMRENTTTDSQGRFSLEYQMQLDGVLRNGVSMSLRAVSDDGKRHWYGDAFFSRELENTPAEELRIVLLPELTMTGIVVDAEGQPIPDAVVRLNDDWRGFFRKETHTAADGTFSLNFPDGVSLEEIIAYKSEKGFDYIKLPGYDPHREDLLAFRPKPDYRGPYTLKLEGAKPITVKAVGPEGEPLEGVRVLVHTMIRPNLDSVTTMGWISTNMSVVTNDRGIATIDWFPSWHQGKTVLQTDTYANDSRQLAAKSHFIAFDPDAQTSLTVPFVRTVLYSGTICDEAGNLVAPIYMNLDYEDKSVGWFNFTGMIIENGQFKFHIPEERVFDLTIFDDRWDAPPMHGLTAVFGQDREDLKFVVRPTTRISGTVTFGQDNQPFHHMLALVNEHGNCRGYNSGRSGRENGEFVFFAGPGTYSVFAGPNSHDMFYLESFTIPENAKEMEVNLHLERDFTNEDYMRLQNREEMQDKRIGNVSFGAPIFLQVSSGVHVTGAVNVVRRGDD